MAAEPANPHEPELTEEAVRGSVIMPAITTDQMYRSRQIVLSHLENRGFDVENYRGFTMKAVEHMRQHDRLDMLVQNPSNRRRAYVRYHTGKISKKVLDNLKLDLYENVSHPFGSKDMVLLISDRPVTESMETLANNLWHTYRVFIVLEEIGALLYDVLKHEYTPRHTILSEEETQAMMTRYFVVDKSQLPSISRTDPVARALGMRPGEVCRIDRPSVTAITSEFYRVCV